MISDYTEKQFVEEFLSNKPVLQPKPTPQRVSDNELISLVAESCRYPKKDVQDVLNGLWSVLNTNLELGREFDFAGIFTAKLYKPFTRRLWDNNQQGFKKSSARPRFKLVPTDKYTRYLHKGIHAVVNYLPPQTLRESSMNVSDFSTVQSTAIAAWQAEENIRAAKHKTVL